MRFLIDKSKHDKQDFLASDLVMGQLLTPLTRYSDWGKTPYGIDNGCFVNLNEPAFSALLKRQEPAKDRCLFVCCPDVVGNGRRTLELWEYRDRWLSGWPKALVLQDGIEDLTIPWDELDAVFVGGSTEWKLSQAVEGLIKTAKILKKWVHVGRVNTGNRFWYFHKLGADSCDGSGVSRHRQCLDEIWASNQQISLF